MRFESARDLFEAARDAARDAARVSRELAEMEGRAESLGSGGFGPRVRSTGEPDRMAGRVAAMVDRGAMLDARLAEDYRVIDAACAVLYGADSDAGLWSLVGWPADAIYHHYLGLRTWVETAAIVGYSEQHVRRAAVAAMELADANGWMWTVLGRGMAAD